MRPEPWLAAGVLLLAAPCLVGASPPGPERTQDTHDLGELDLPTWKIGLVFADEVPVETILAEFSAMTGIRILYEPPAPRQQISFSIRDASAAEVLLGLAQAAGFTYEVIDRHTLVVGGTPATHDRRRREIPLKTHHVAPVYPTDLIGDGISATVVLEVTILRDGAVGTVEVLRGSGLGMEKDASSVAVALDASAIEAVRQWRFRPFTFDDGRPAEMITTVAVRFDAETIGQS